MTMSPAEAAALDARDPIFNDALVALVTAAARSQLLNAAGSSIQAVHDGITVTVERKGFPPSEVSGE